MPQELGIDPDNTQTVLNEIATFLFSEKVHESQKVLEKEERGQKPEQKNTAYQKAPNRDTGIDL